MKKTTKVILTAFFITIIGANIQCKKEQQGGSECKTCRAFDANGTIEKEVCSDAAETAFRNQYSGREISCR